MNFETLLQKDAQLSSRMRVAEQPGLFRTLAAILAHSGDSWFWILGVAVIYLGGNADWRWRVTILAIGIVVTAVIVMIIKFTVRRSRPEGEWGNIYRNTDPHSFPSGHAARSALLAVLALGLGPPWFGLLLVVWAPLVSLARVAMGVHYLSDVLVGMVFGGVMGAVILALL